MIDPLMFDMSKLVSTLLGDEAVRPGLSWRRECIIVPTYMPKNGARPRCVVRFGEDWFLRYSAGPAQGHFWDMYGEDYLTPELAFVALINAPPPPFGKPYVQFDLKVR